MADGHSAGLPSPHMGPRPLARLQTLRRCTQGIFFATFLLAPAFNWLRMDVHGPQLWLLGKPWALEMLSAAAPPTSNIKLGWELLSGLFIPVLMLVALFLGLAYRYGRIYCGWLCPHFSMVEFLNQLLHRVCGKFSVWERRTSLRPGDTAQPQWWPMFALACLLMGFVWAVTLMTYLLPPAEVWGGLWHGTLPARYANLLGVGSLVLALEFAFARHFFCRFGCAVGLFQSLMWMANDKAMVVAFARQRARECKTCGADSDTLGSACDRVCPMRLHPRNIKRMMFSCVQCGQCLRACDQTQVAQGRSASLQWQVGEQALRECLHQRKAVVMEQV